MLSSPGRITSYLPFGGPFVRMDSHVYPDYVAPPSYDSLLGKVYLVSAFVLFVLFLLRVTVNIVAGIGDL